MYRLDRTRRLKFAAFVFAFLSVALTVWGYCAGGYEIIEYGFMNEPLPSIVMVTSFFAAVIFLFLFILIRGIEKDMAENLKSIDKDRQ